MIKGTLGAALVPFTVIFARTAAAAQNPPLDPGDPVAKALGYAVVSTRPDEKCANCSQFLGKAGDAGGGCTAFPGKDVPAAGYCKAWAKRVN